MMGLGVSYLMGYQEVAGGIFLHLTAVQLLWINVIADGPPALALALDRHPGVMQHCPQPANSPLLDAVSLRFIVTTGVIKALAGVALLVALPQFGYSLEQTRTAVFVFEALAQLAFAYPARRVTVVPLPYCCVDGRPSCSGVAASRGRRSRRPSTRKPRYEHTQPRTPLPTRLVGRDRRRAWARR